VAVSNGTTGLHAALGVGEGDDVLIGTNSVVDGSCTIGDRVSVQTGVYITANTIGEGGELIGPVIKKGARIGANAVILPGVVVGEGAVVGAGAVVTRDVRDGETVVGNPSRKNYLKSCDESLNSKL